MEFFVNIVQNSPITSFADPADRHSGADGPVADLIRSAAKELGFSLRSYESWERESSNGSIAPTYDRVHSSKTRYNLRRQRRLLEEETGAEVCLADRTGRPHGAFRVCGARSEGLQSVTRCRDEHGPG